MHLHPEAKITKDLSHPTFSSFSPLEGASEHCTPKPTVSGTVPTSHFFVVLLHHRMSKHVVSTILSQIPSMCIHIWQIKLILINYSLSGWIRFNNLLADFLTQNFKENSYTCSPLPKGSISESDEESLYSQSAGKWDGFVLVTSVQGHNLQRKINTYRQTRYEGTCSY